MSDLMLDVSQAAELKLAFRRNGDWTNADIKTLSEGSILGDVLKVIRGQAEIKIIGKKNADDKNGWEERDGVIYFSVTSDGTTGPKWIERLEKKGFRVKDYAKSVLRSNDFKPTSGIMTEIAVLKGRLFENINRLTKNIRAEADKRKLTAPNAEVACLIREMFTDEELEAMGLHWIVTMHEPINDSGGVPSLLGVDRDDNGRGLYACYGKPDSKWDRDDGFAFVVSQASALKA